jgi:integrin-linked kinase-associated serine/threonine phosphatase 2C
MCPINEPGAVSENTPAERPSVISREPWQDVNEGNELGFGYSEIKGRRRSQEDALAWCVLPPSSLSPIEMGRRLWTCYRQLDEDAKTLRSEGSGFYLRKSGTTAATTVYDGKGALITAALADAVSFAVAYDREGNPLGVTRLNSVIHHPSDPREASRIADAGGSIIGNRVNGDLAVSRAIGDHGDLKRCGVCAEAQLDIMTVADIKKRHEEIGQVAFVQLIITCDGFTEPVDSLHRATERTSRETQESHEKYLLEALKQLKKEQKITEKELAEKLTAFAMEQGSNDNVSVAVQSITETTPPFLMGVYDGHGGINASNFVAGEIGTIFEGQCRLSNEEYARQELSIDRNLVQYLRDNHSVDVMANQIVPPAPPISEVTDPVTTPLSVVEQPKSKGPNTVTTPVNDDSSKESKGDASVPKTYNLSIVGLNGHTHCILFKSTDTVGTMKERIHELEKIPADSVRIIFCGQSIDDDNRQIGSCEFEKDGKIHWVSKKLEASKVDTPVVPEVKSVDPDATPSEEETIKKTVAFLLKATQTYQDSLGESKAHRAIKPIIEKLNNILGSEQLTDRQKVLDYYQYLNASVSNQNTSVERKNIDLIKKDRGTDRFQFCRALIIAATILTGILPGLIILIGIWAVTKQNPLPFYNRHARLFRNSIDPLAPKEEQASPENDNSPKA